jgi:hypothetical protein
MNMQKYCMVLNYIYKREIFLGIALRCQNIEII